LGFDHGWLCLNPTFLNLHLPVLIVDQRLLPEPTPLGLEPFGTRNPLLPLPDTTIVVELHPGAMISLWNTDAAQRELLAWHRTAAGHTSWPVGDATDAVVIVGDSHRIELSWAALWDGHIGRARLIDTAGQRNGAWSDTKGPASADAAR
jgi:hypothetical protein